MPGRAGPAGRRRSHETPAAAEIEFPLPFEVKNGKEKGFCSIDLGERVAFQPFPAPAISRANAFAAVARALPEDVRVCVWSTFCLIEYASRLGLLLPIL